VAKKEYKETIVVRKDLDFGLTADDIPNYWMANDPFKSRMIDAVQSTFPDGERYFISSVQAFRSQINDPVLLEEVKDFSIQEGQHGIVHTDYNQRLQRQGINVDAFTKHTKRLTEWRLKNYSPEYNVAMTAALEHFTAMMADLFFAEKTILEGAHPRVRAMLAWHAIEEMEHKAVAFNVMTQIAKVGYFRRVLAMTHASLSFSFFTLVAPWFMLKMDGHTLAARFGIYARGLAWMMHPRKGPFFRLCKMIAPYYKPSFHPNDIPSVHNYDDWVASYSADRDPVKAGEAMYSAAT
jgi:predicted metal-dependent hydrolase